MTRQNPFSGSGYDNKTVVRPMPGGRRRQAPMAEPAPHAEPSVYPGRREYTEVSIPTGLPNGGSSFTDCALPLLMVVPKLRGLAQHYAVGDLQEQMSVEIKAFQNRALQQGASEEQVRIAAYFICSLIDETVLNTPWGRESNWGHDSLLVMFHKEAWGGEKFFEILDRLIQRPAQNLHLLEIAYLCLSLGFEGKYRISQQGSRDLEHLRHEVYGLIQRIKSDSEGSLSANWRGLTGVRNPLSKAIPTWVLASVAGLLLIGVYLGYAYALNATSNRVYSQWMTIASEEGRVAPAPKLVVAPPVQERPAADPSRVDRFRVLLAQEIKQKMVDVLDGPILRITGAFPSGGDQVLKAYQPMLVKIARELQTDNSRVEVIGHTDDQPIFNARFQSNWDLSKARARNVADILVASGSLKDRVLHKGRAESDPVVPNDTPERRALNRRIDIHIR